MPTSKNFDRLLKLMKERNEDGFKQMLRSLSPSQRLDVLKEQGDQKITLLKYAAARGFTEIIKVVITLLPESELYNILAIQDDNGNTLLSVAACYGSTDIVKLIANAVPTAVLYSLIRIQNKIGDTPLRRGLVEEKTETAKYILECLPASDMSKVISIPNNKGHTVLSRVAQFGLMDVLKLCVDIIPPAQLFSKVLVADDDGDTAIHCAAYGNQSEAAVYLLDKLTKNQVKEILEIRNKEGYTPIEYAKSEDHNDFATTANDYLNNRKIFLKGFAATLEANSIKKLTWPITDEDIVEKYLNESDVKTDIINLPLRSSTQPNTEDMYNCKEKYYQMTSPIRGRCLIINNRDFEVPSTPDQVKLDKRKGSDVDVANIVNVFTQLSFICEVHTNLTNRPDSLGFFTEDSPSGAGATVNDIKQKSDPFPGDHLSTDDLFLLKASFLSE
ncbi:CASP2 [Bugula neritina]|uniref:CASP2 n=1 Tax=Bugula neritina TaxID=10212 RepID=A0A7J7JT55_BUGNE|nr:CASP2 [Bugula neritina]